MFCAARSVNAVTDVTGFGLFGHAHEMADRSGVRIQLESERFPAIDGALDLARKNIRTSGDPRNRDFAGRHLTFKGVAGHSRRPRLRPADRGRAARFAAARSRARRSRPSSLPAVSSCAASGRSKRAPASSSINLGAMKTRDDPWAVPTVPPRASGVHARRRRAQRRALGGITNPDPARVKPEASDPARHLPESNPYTYDERLLMVKAAAADLGLGAERCT